MATDRNQDQRESQVLDNPVDRSGMMHDPEATKNEHDESQTCPTMEVIQKQAQPRGFLDLPAEIRNKIYRFALVTTPQCYRYGLGDFIFSPAPPALTLVNKQIFAEALTIYYAGNKFYLLLWAKEDGLRDQDPVLFHRFTQMMGCFGRQTTSPTDESPLRYIKNIVIQINTSTDCNPLNYSKVYSTVGDHVNRVEPWFRIPANPINQAYSSLCIRGEKQRMAFTSNSATEEQPFYFTRRKPFDPTKYRWTVKNVKFGRGDKFGSKDRFRSVKEAYDLTQMSFTRRPQFIEEAIRFEYNATRGLQEFMAMHYD